MFRLFKLARRIFYEIKRPVDKLRCRILFWGNNVVVGRFKTSGVPFISVAMGGSCAIGENFSMHNGAAGNPIGFFAPCTIVVDKGARLIVGNNVGMSQTALICHIGITIEDNVKLGGGVKIYDTDFHSLDPEIRKNAALDMINKAKKKVTIRSNAFIGAHTTVLKGVTIGENSIVGACSLVTKDVPANEIWAGNPARFIRKLD